ncbi:MgtC/SapB family protein [Pseudothauera nasutitermitis]|uniref:MgtC/SapB family protein n=1 Tax=Pseudothauera nasutitermitis TaxID=2565930 RepID=A0A4S4B0W4_9RHOO|nr:MgtC/SapB family protein [Pseudothauera nasutitermitis]THF66144.1 MgtC/SapB family protein [Pseudothauera nasutitermitis]
MPFSMPFDMEQAQAFLIAVGIGLLIGLERERVPSARAGLRTFGLVAMFGALAALLGEHLHSIAPLAVGMAAIGAMIIAAYLRHPDPSDPGTTSVAALLVCFCLGAAVWYGYATLAVMLAVGTTILLYFKAQLRGIATRLRPRDWISILQFSVLSVVILPILPDQEFGPYGALNPYQVWWMVVLISGVSLAGYAALQLVGARYGAAFVGVFGGLASSTATTLVYARNARAEPGMASMAALVIVLANLLMVVRVTVIALVVAPGVIGQLLTVVLPALLLGVIALLWNWRRLSNGGEVVLPQTGNPTELRTALGFGALYALVLFIAAWMAEIAGNSGLYVLAVVSGLTDIDAIALSSLRLFALDKLDLAPTVIVIGLGMVANLAFKTGLAVVIGGRALGRKVLGGMGAVAIGLALGIAWSAIGAPGL